MRSILEIQIAVKEAEPNISDEELRLCVEWGTVERMFAAQKKTPQEWLGPGNIPGSPEQRQRLAWGKKVYEKATGEKLD